MTRPDPDRARIADRAELLPEERAAGSDDRDTQAETILEESDHRVDNPEDDARESTQTIPVMTAEESRNPNAPDVA